LIAGGRFADLNQLQRIRLSVSVKATLYIVDRCYSNTLPLNTIIVANMQYLIAFPLAHKLAKSGHFPQKPPVLASAIPRWLGSINLCGATPEIVTYFSSRAHAYFLLTFAGKRNLVPSRNIVALEREKG
jgi:hypothetical protein